MSALFRLTFELVAVQGQFRHQVEKGEQKAVGGFRVVAVRSEAVDKDDLILYSFLNVRYMLTCLFKLFTKGWHQHCLGFPVAATICLPVSKIERRNALSSLRLA